MEGRIAQEDVAQEGPVARAEVAQVQAIADDLEGQVPPRHRRIGQSQPADWTLADEHLGGTVDGDRGPEVAPAEHRDAKDRLGFGRQLDHGLERHGGLIARHGPSR
jgi:hypothetical protein